MSTASPERCTVALIGAGYTADEHARAFADVPGVFIGGIHSRTRSTAETLASRHGIPAVCDSVTELYERTRADLVVITVGELAANAVSRECFQFPWAVFMEKPPGYSLRDAEQIQRAAAGRRVLVGFNRRFISSTSAVLTDLRELDGHRYVKVTDQENQALGREAGKPDTVVRNWMFANSIHVIDYLRVFCRGKIVAVNAILPWNPDAPEVVISRIDFDSGDVGVYEGIWHAPGPWAVSVTVPGRRWEMRPLERLEQQRLGEALLAVEAHEWDRRFKPGFRAQAENAVASAFGNPSRSVYLDDAIETMRLIATIFGADEW